MSVPSTSFIRFENGFGDNNSSAKSGGFKSSSTNFGSGGLDSDAFVPKGLVPYLYHVENCFSSSTASLMVA
jgi:hypothetical protein